MREHDVIITEEKRFPYNQIILLTSTSSISKY